MQRDCLVSKLKYEETRKNNTWLVTVKRYEEQYIHIMEEKDTVDIQVDKRDAQHGRKYW